MNSVKHINYQRLIQFIDLTNLADVLNKEELIMFCQKSQTASYKVAALCVEKAYVEFCKNYLSSGIPIATVFNFPYGNEEVAKIQDDIAQSLNAGADELDIVIPLEQLKKADNIMQFKNIIVNFVSVMREFVGTKTLKFIISTDVLNEISLIKAASEAVIRGKGDFIKTATGKTGTGVTLEALGAILEVITQMKSNVGVKASGNVKNAHFAAQIYHLAEKAYHPEKITTKNFRLGASSLLEDLLFYTGS